MSDLEYIHKTRREKCIKAHLTTTSIAICRRNQLLNIFGAYVAAADFFFWPFLVLLPLSSSLS